MHYNNHSMVVCAKYKNTGDRAPKFPWESETTCVSEEAAFDPGLEGCVEDKTG